MIVRRLARGDLSRVGLGTHQGMPNDGSVNGAGRERDADSCRGRVFRLHRIRANDRRSGRCRQGGTRGRRHRGIDAARTAHAQGDPRRVVEPRRRAGARASAPGAGPSGHRARGGAGRGRRAHRRCAARRVGARARPGMDEGDSEHADDPCRRRGNLPLVSVPQRRCEPVAARRNARFVSPRRPRGGLRCLSAHPPHRRASGRPVGVAPVVADRDHLRALPASGSPAARLRGRRLSRGCRRQPSDSPGQSGGSHPGQRGRLDLVRGDGRAFRAVAQAPELEALRGR